MKEIPAALLRWYDHNARVLPWRGIHDPYRTWVSEAMLQQTRVDTVLGYYDRFLADFPTLSALAAASEEQVLKRWEGLGYYSRARNLLAGARQVMAEFGGVLPRDPEQLEKIRGIGPYTARAIASIAYQVPVPAVDGNVIRVLSRLYGLREDMSRPEPLRALKALAADLVPPERPGDWNQALMDLGATICVPGTPECDRCPLCSRCDAFRAGDAPDLPHLPAAKPPKELAYDVLILFSGDRVLLRRRTEPLLQGLWCFPMLEASADPRTLTEKKLRLPLSALTPAGAARHVFTHRVWKMTLFSGEVAPEAPAPAGYSWIPFRDFSSLPLPTAMKAPAAVVRQRMNPSETLQPSSIRSQGTGKPGR